MQYILASLLVLSPTLANATAPEWFCGDDTDRYEVFSAWKRLSTRDASIAIGPRWGTVGGVIRDESGEPIRNCALRIQYGGLSGAFSVWLQTDDEGRFVLYGIHDRPETSAEQQARQAEEERKAGGPEQAKRRRIFFGMCGPKGYHFRVAIGFPTTYYGRTFASKTDGWQGCRVETCVEVSNEWYFCELTCVRDSQFDERAFQAFVKEDSERPIQRRDDPYRHPVGEARNEDRQSTAEHTVHVIDSNDKPVNDARLIFSAHDGRVGNSQTVATDENGRATLKEYLSDRGAINAENVRRSLAVDVKGGAVGPVDINFEKKGVHVVRVPEPATVKGRIVDWHGHPISGHSSGGIQYRDHTLLAFETDLNQGGGCRFGFSRIMPGAPFQVEYIPLSMYHATPCHARLTPLLPARSKEVTLKPGEARKDLELVVRPAAALRGVVLDENGDELTEGTVIEYSRPYDSGEGWTGWYRIGENGPNHGTLPEPQGPRFGHSHLGDYLIRFRARANGYASQETPRIMLEPGELRLITIKLQPE